MTYGQMLRGLNEEQRLLMLDELIYTIDCAEVDQHIECDEKWASAFECTTGYIKERLSEIYIDDKRQEFHCTEIE